MLREVKFYVRDLFRGPNAKTLPGFLTFGLLVGLLSGALVGFAFIGLLEVLSRV